MVRELLNPRPAPEPLAAGRLRKALQLSRMMLFELDVTIMQYVNHAHIAVLANMWRHRQPAAAVSLARHALGNTLLTEIQEEQGECWCHANARSIGQRVSGSTDTDVSGSTDTSFMNDCRCAVLMPCLADLVVLRLLVHRVVQFMPA
jgi:hypothetical protein